MKIIGYYNLESHLNSLNNLDGDLYLPIFLSDRISVLSFLKKYLFDQSHLLGRNKVTLFALSCYFIKINPARKIRTNLICGEGNII